MRSFKKKLTVLFAGALLACSAASLGGCAGYNPAALPGDISGEVTSNGGFVVEKGNYVYFINGSEQSDADNTYGDVVKGALYRIGKTDLKTGKYDQAERVVSSLFVAQNYDGGVFQGRIIILIRRLRIFRFSHYGKGERRRRIQFVAVVQTREIRRKFHAERNRRIPVPSG